MKKPPSQGGPTGHRTSVPVRIAADLAHFDTGLKLCITRVLQVLTPIYKTRIEMDESEGNAWSNRMFPADIYEEYAYHVNSRGEEKNESDKSHIHYVVCNKHSYFNISVNCISYW